MISSPYYILEGYYKKIKKIKKSVDTKELT